MEVALTDMDIVWEDKKANQAQCQAMIREAASEGADLIVFPEMTLTGFSFDVNKVKDEKDETIAFFSRLAKEYGIAAGFGYVTEQEGKGRNHFCVVDRAGEVRADYIKIHPFALGGEADFYAGGDGVCRFDLGEFSCGAFICYDLRFPEAFQQLPLDTGLILVIANWPESRLAQWRALLRARAIEMQCFVAGVNRIGEGGGLRYAKSSAAFGPDGSELPERQGERNRYVTLDLAALLRYVEKFPFRRDRRPSAYRLKK